MGRKRDKPYPSSHLPSSAAKRRRPPPPTEDDDLEKPVSKPAPPLALVVVDLPLHCSVLDLKSRFEIYGSISRIRIDRDCVGYITYRTKDSADAAMTAALDPSFAFTIDSKKVQVLWANDPQVQWRQGINVGVNKNKELSSKLLRAEVPLSRHGRSNKLASTIVNPRRSNSSSSHALIFAPCYMSFFKSIELPQEYRASSKETMSTIGLREVVVGSSFAKQIQPAAKLGCLVEVKFRPSSRRCSTLLYPPPEYST